MAVKTLSMPRNVDHLVDIITKSAHRLDKSLSTNEYCQFSLQNGANKENGVADGFLENQDARVILLSACQTLQRVVMGPTEMLKNMALIEKHNLVALQIINHYGISQVVPPEGQISMQDAATKCGLPAEILARVLRLAMTYDVFCEPEIGFVAHTEASLQIPKLSPLLWYQLEICWPSTLRLLDWLKLEGEDKTKAPFQVAHSTKDSWWSYAEKRPSFIQDYGKYMAIITSGGPHDVSHAVRGFKWEELGDGIVVDIGGADGFVAVTLAQAYPNLTIIVQDSVNLKQSADAKIPSSLMNRVFFVPHSFFDPQLALGCQADVFLLRHILHDWEDEYCLVILRQLSEAMKPGARIIVAEQVIGKPRTENLYTEQVMRALDMQMLVQFGGKERTLDDWRALFKLADPAFEIVGSVQPLGSADTLMELQKRTLEDADSVNGFDNMDRVGDVKTNRIP